MKYRVFISSVQAEFSDIRLKLYELFEQDTLLRHYFTPYLFERDRVKGKSPQEVYLDELDRSQIYLMLCGQEYGYEDKDGVSPTEHEYHRAKEQSLERWIFLKKIAKSKVHPKEQTLIDRINLENKRSSFQSWTDLSQQVIDAAIGFLQEQGDLERKTFDTSVNVSSSIDDLDLEQIKRFMTASREIGRLRLPKGMSPEDALYHLELLTQDGQLTNAALLTFGKTPQHFFPSAFAKCVQFYGTEVAKPLADEKVYRGHLFHQIESSYAWVLDKLARKVNPKGGKTSAEVTYEIPPLAIREAIVNALAHRDYHSRGSVQIMLFRDRLEISNPGKLQHPLSIEVLKGKHRSYPPNQLLADILYYDADLEQLGTGITDIYNQCRAASLQAPEISTNEGFTITLYRPAADPASTPQVPRKHPPSTPQVDQDSASTAQLPRNYRATTAQVDRDRASTVQLPGKYHASTVQVLQLVEVMTEEHSTRELRDMLNLKNRDHFRITYLNPAMADNLVMMKYPQSPNSPKQRYLLTPEGLEVQAALKKEKKQ